VKRKKRYSAVEILALLRKVETATAHGSSMGAACRDAGISDHSYYRWRKEHGGGEPAKSRGRGAK
jgi:transposase-like protein